MIFYIRDNKRYTQVVVNDPELPRKLNSSINVAFIVHGYIDNINRRWVRQTITNWIKYQDVQVCAVDWARLAAFEYSITANVNTYMVGDFLAVFIKYLMRNGFIIENMIIVGHSLGAHIAGFTGAALNGRLSQIIGLDPAAPLFTFPIVVSNADRLDPSDAQWVQVIHTTSGLLGTPYQTGHQDFYPNGGIAPQPGCIIPLITDSPTPESLSCSHLIATFYFYSSLIPNVHCGGSNCYNNYLWLTRQCHGNPIDILGIYNYRRRGTFYFATDSVFPYCTGYV